MFQKKIILLLLLLLSSCGYEAIYSKKNSLNYDFTVSDLSFVGDKIVNLKIKEKLNNYTINKKNKNWRTKKIKARFICALTIYNKNKEIINSLGKVEGFISPIIKGKNGFGYDPIFIPIGKKITFGEMRASQKYKIDHRFKAFKKIKKLF